MIDRIIDEARNDAFFQRWLTGRVLKINIVVSFVVMAFAMHLSLKLLTNYDNWPIESLIIQYATLFIPLMMILSFPLVKGIKNNIVRKCIQTVMLVMAFISIMMLSIFMGLISSGEGLDPFGSILLIFGVLGFGLLTRLAWKAGKREGLNS